jgi:hypothetical protein
VHFAEQPTMLTLSAEEADRAVRRLIKTVKARRSGQRHSRISRTRAAGLRHCYKHHETLRKILIKLQEIVQHY